MVLLKGVPHEYAYRFDNIIHDNAKKGFLKWIFLPDARF